MFQVFLLLAQNRCQYLEIIFAYDFSQNSDDDNIPAYLQEIQCDIYFQINLCPWVRGQNERFIIQCLLYFSDSFEKEKSLNQFEMLIDPQYISPHLRSDASPGFLFVWHIRKKNNRKNSAFLGNTLTKNYRDEIFYHCCFHVIWNIHTSMQTHTLLFCYYWPSSQLCLIISDFIHFYTKSECYINIEIY